MRRTWRKCAPGSLYHPNYKSVICIRARYVKNAPVIFRITNGSIPLRSAGARHHASIASSAPSRAIAATVSADDGCVYPAVTVASE